MTDNRRFHLAKRPEGTPGDDTFDLREVDRPDPGPGEALVRVLFLSVDPYMRGRMSAAESYADPWEVDGPLYGAAVCEVIESNGATVDEGATVVGNVPWAEYAAVDGSDLTPVDTGELPVSTALGVLGMPGRTAYFGTREVAQPRAGDTMVVSGAAGAVGSVVGQLAELQGADAVGVAGTDEKVEWLTEELGFSAGINYDTEDVGARLNDLTDGVDAYFDNVGGPVTDAVFPRLDVDARVAVCGQIALYNAEERPTGPRKLSDLIRTRASVEGFLVGDFAPRFAEATAFLRDRVASGDLSYRETVTEGFENAPDAFLGLFEGENVGKQVVKVADPDGE
ncbi:NADP-dependent oxidoreductase [Candidatus Halobonum tyrrellensis]|uniref:Alcohol dehydrogenase zinc-binding domain protein n=1 Tax=Candidatus Halobonum tyrrellensis G22 TaxID=1324957 RepID=V4HC81_9EURY|nr:NADP-dependent oxidoreductase [Candidatus Halobonum tyrrellensis]ESP87668.1 alcohol dehydrogenase zinc-binding domain protein [Candidatus Halobonum tyrrellensis G22]